jgi:hypothetical protein
MYRRSLPARGPGRCRPSGSRAPSRPAPVDRSMAGFMRRWGVCGVQRAAARDGRLVRACSFGAVGGARPGALPAPAVDLAARFRAWPGACWSAEGIAHRARGTAAPAGGGHDQPRRVLQRRLAQRRHLDPEVVLSTTVPGHTRRIGAPLDTSLPFASTGRTHRRRSRRDRHAIPERATPAGQQAPRPEGAPRLGQLRLGPRRSAPRRISGVFSPERPPGQGLLAGPASILRPVRSRDRGDDERMGERCPRR